MPTVDQIQQMLDEIEAEERLADIAPEIERALDDYTAAQWRAVRADFDAASHQTARDYDRAEKAEDAADAARGALARAIVDALVGAKIAH